METGSEPATPLKSPFYSCNRYYDLTKNFLKKSKDKKPYLNFFDRCMDESDDKCSSAQNNDSEYFDKLYYVQNYVRSLYMYYVKSKVLETLHRECLKNGLIVQYFQVLVIEC